MKTVDWNQYKADIDAFALTANQADLIWNRSLGSIDRFMEDHETERFNTITLPALVQYNYIRSWPLSKETPAGQLDKESVMVFLNIQQIQDLDPGYIQNNHLNFDASADRFEIDGVKYRSKGDSQAGQAGSDPLTIFIILERENVQT